MNTRIRAKRRRFAIAALVAGATLLLAACAPETAPISSDELVDSGKDVESISVGLEASLSNLYIGQESGINNFWVAANVQEGLVGIDPDGNLVPGLATDWSMPDPSTYVFTLRDDAKFQNGDTLTPEDVIFSLQVAADPTLSPGIAAYLSAFESAEQTGPNEITVRTNRPDASFLASLSPAGALVVTQKSFWEEHGGSVGTSDALLMGTGPYRVTEFAPDSHVTLERVDTWWGGVPKAKQVRIEFIPDENTRLIAAQKGDIDVAFRLPLKQLAQWEGISSGRTTADLNSLSYTGLIFDQLAAPFDDPKVREAVAHAVDRGVLVDKVLRGNGEVASAIMAPDTMIALADQEQADELLSEIPQYEFDLDKAEEALKGSSVPDGFTTEITYPNGAAELGTAAQAIAENLKRIGITLKVREVPLEEWLATLGDGEHGLGFMMYFSTMPDPGAVSSYLLGEGNPGNIKDPQALDLIGQAAAETDPAARIDVLLELERLSAENIYNAPLWWGNSNTFISNSVGFENYKPYALAGPWAAQLFAAESSK